MTERQEWLLLFLGMEDGQYPVDQVRAMKGMFLLDQRVSHPDQRMYHFDAYDYGPFDSAVYRDLDALKIARLVNVTTPAGSNRRIYQVSDQGREAHRALATNKSSTMLNQVREVKRRVTSVGFEALLDEIYKEFPQYAINSRARFLGA